MALLTLQVNGVPRTANVPAGATLLEFLHDGLELAGVRVGCEEGVCGACTVLVENQPVRSCMITAAACAGKRILTLEGLSRNGQLHPVQQALLRHGALRCGFCTPGMILEAVALLEDASRPLTRRRLRRAIEGHVCRCGMQERILEAVEEAAERMGRLKPERAREKEL